MEYQTMLIVGQTVVVCIIATVAIMWCFFEEAEAAVKVKKE